MYRLIEKLHLERYLNSRLILAIDLVVSGVASLCALVLVRLLLPPLSNISKFALLWIGCAVVYSFITFFLLKTYRSSATPRCGKSQNSSWRSSARNSCWD